MGGFRPQGCGYPVILASFVTYVRPVLNFPGEVGEMAKKWPKNDPLVVGGGRQIKLDRTLPHFQYLGRLEAFRQKNQRISPHRVAHGWF